MITAPLTVTTRNSALTGSSRHATASPACTTPLTQILPLRVFRSRITRGALFMGYRTGPDVAQLEVIALAELEMLEALWHSEFVAQSSPAAARVSLCVSTVNPAFAVAVSAG